MVSKLSSPSSSDIYISRTATDSVEIPAANLGRNRLGTVSASSPRGRTRRSHIWRWNFDVVIVPEMSLFPVVGRCDNHLSTRSSNSPWSQISHQNFDCDCRSFRDKNISGFGHLISIFAIGLVEIAVNSLFELAVVVQQAYRFIIGISMISVIFPKRDILFPVLAAILLPFSGVVRCRNPLWTLSSSSAWSTIPDTPLEFRLGLCLLQSQRQHHFRFGGHIFCCPPMTHLSIYLFLELAVV